MKKPASDDKAEAFQLKGEVEQLLSTAKLAVARAAGRREVLSRQVDEAERKLASLAAELERRNHQAASSQDDLAEVGAYARDVHQRLLEVLSSRSWRALGLARSMAALIRRILHGRSYDAQVSIPAEPPAMRRALSARESRRPVVQRPSHEGMRGSGAISSAKAPVVRYPVDFHRLAASGVLLPKFGKIQVDRQLPSRYPFELSLPPPVGNKNDFGFLMEAIHQLGCVGGMPDKTVNVVAWVRSGADLERLAQGLASQTLPRGRFKVTVFVDTEEVSRPVEWADHSLEGRPWRESRQEKDWLPGANADVIVFLDGEVCPDCQLLERIIRHASVSPSIVIGLVPGGIAGRESIDADVQFQPVAREWMRSRFPFRELQGFNFAVSRSLLEETGGFDPRFHGHRKAVMELCYRAYNRGAYFIPLPVIQAPSRAPPSKPGRDADISDRHLFQELCPVHWYRKGNGRYEVPKVSIYMPAHNAEEFICEAINSVLEQDFEDLEVCVHVDGASDRTLDVLERNYSGNARVRWSVGANAGIGHASNRAIGLARGLYIGQLDSDDRLKPGAVRRLAEFLDEHADVGCVYSSCVRVDREGRYLQDEYSWPEFSREKMMLTSIVHHFRMFRRQAWQRTEKFREDAANAVDYDMLLKLSDVTEFHHIDEKFYERRWHGGNTSSVNEELQTRNTHVFQGMALERQGLLASWEVNAFDKSRPRRVTYVRKAVRKRVVFWPDYTGADPYQRLLYRGDIGTCDFTSADIEVAIRMAREAADPENILFHLHWLDPLVQGAKNEAEARDVLDSFLRSVEELRGLGGKVVWTIHGCISHDAKFPVVEREFRAKLAATVDNVHVHAGSSVPEIEQDFPLPGDRVFVSAHGGYRGIYPDFIPREVARQRLGLDESDVAILFFGKVRPCKELASLFRACEALVRCGHPVKLILAGQANHEMGKEIDSSNDLKGRVRLLDRRLDAAELQVFFRAADVGVLPDQRIAPGPLMLSLSFGLPPVVPSAGMTREVLRGREAGFLYGPGEERETLEDALSAALGEMASGRWQARRLNAQMVADEARWPRFMAGLVPAGAGGGTDGGMAS